MPGTSLTSYEPSLRDKLAWMMGDMFGDNRTLRNWAQDRVRGSVDLLPVVGDAVGFDDAKRDFDAGNYGSAAVNAGLSAVGSVPGVGDAVATGLKAGGHALGILAGPMAKGFDIEKSWKAADMAADNKTPTQIWKETGYQYDPINRVRSFEIPDQGAKINLAKLPEQHEIPRGSVKLGDFLDHPELYENYPDLKNMPVKSQIGDSLGHYQPSGGRFKEHIAIYPETIGDANADEMGDISWEMMRDKNTTAEQMMDAMGPFYRPTTLHETQHAIQNREAWDGGFSPDEAFLQFKRPGSFPNGVFANVFGMSPEEAMAGKMPVTPAVADWLKNLIQETYLRNVGETQARNVMKRAKMSRDEIKQIPPVLTQDRRWGEQLTQDDIRRGIYDPEDLPGLNLAGPAKRRR